MVVQKNSGDTVWKITFIVVLVLGLSLGACGDVDVGEAQVFDRGVRTYDIVPNTLQLQSDTNPTILVNGEATQYTLVAEGRVIFTANDTTGNRNIFLDADDIVIERPLANSVTVVTQRNRLL